MAGETHNLDIHDTEVLAEWFMYHLSMEQRTELVAELPLIYSRMFPTVPPSRILSFVEAAIKSERKN